MTEPAVVEVGLVSFPPPTGININMMPFIMGYGSSLPVDLHVYEPLIQACGLEEGQTGKIGYLSIMESAVTAERPSQRRPGIHTEKHPQTGWGGGGWGSGKYGYGRQDGIYMASTVARSCRAWDTRILQPGPMGDCEHFRKHLESRFRVLMDKDTLYWLTDSTPHESLPLKPGTFRQWFRLVTHKVDLWYADHSTANPLGVMPQCKIIHGDKFTV